MAELTNIQKKALKDQVKDIQEDARKKFTDKNFKDALHRQNSAILFSRRLGDAEVTKELYDGVALIHIQEMLLANDDEHFKDVLDSGEEALNYYERFDMTRKLYIDSLLAGAYSAQENHQKVVFHGQRALSYAEEIGDMNCVSLMNYLIAIAYYNIGMVSKKNKLLEDSVSYGEKALHCCRNGGNDGENIIPLVRWLLVDVYFFQEDYENAIKQFEEDKELMLAEHDVKNHMRAGKIHLVKNRLDETGILFKIAKEYAIEGKETAKKPDKKKLNRLVKEANDLEEECRKHYVEENLEETNVG